jgi:uncharacterized protein YndB with AHSA1/START domain
MPVDIVTEVHIAAPPERVAAYAADPANAPEWYANIDSVEWLTEPPVTLGSRMAFVARFLGRRLAYTYEVVELVPGERLVMRTAQGPFPMETTYVWEPDGTGTRRACATAASRPASPASRHPSWRLRCAAPTVRTSPPSRRSWNAHQTDDGACPALSSSTTTFLGRRARLAGCGELVDGVVDRDPDGGRAGRVVVADL